MREEYKFFELILDNDVCIPNSVQYVLSFIVTFKHPILCAGVDYQVQAHSRTFMNTVNKIQI